MSHDKNLINQIKYKSVKSNPSTRASQEIPYTALDQLITVNDNVLFSIVDQDNAVNNKMTVLQLYDYIRALRTNTTLQKTWTLANGNILTLTEDELNSNVKIIITMEDLSSLASDFELVIPSTWDDTKGVKIEIDYKAFTDQNTSYKLTISNELTSGFYYDYFLLIKGINPANLEKQNNYKVKFDLLNGQLRNPFGLIGYIISAGTSVPPKLPESNNSGVSYKLKFYSVNSTSSITPNSSGGIQIFLETSNRQVLSVIYENVNAREVTLSDFSYKCTVKDTVIDLNVIVCFVSNQSDIQDNQTLIISKEASAESPIGDFINLRTGGTITYNNIELAIYFEGEL